MSLDAYVTGTHHPSIVPRDPGAFFQRIISAHRQKLQSPPNRPVILSSLVQAPHPLATPSPPI